MNRSTSSLALGRLGVILILVLETEGLCTGLKGSALERRSVFRLYYVWYAKFRDDLVNYGNNRVCWSGFYRFDDGISGAIIRDYQKVFAVWKLGKIHSNFWPGELLEVVISRAVRVWILALRFNTHNMTGLSSPPSCQFRETTLFHVRVILFLRLLGVLRGQDLQRTLVTFFRHGYSHSSKDYFRVRSYCQLFYFLPCGKICCVYARRPGSFLPVSCFYLFGYCL